MISHETIQSILVKTKMEKVSLKEPWPSIHLSTPIMYPKMLKEALRDPRRKRVMEKEISALDKNETWVKCEKPQGKKTVGRRWVYTIKY